METFQASSSNAQDFHQAPPESHSQIWTNLLKKEHTPNNAAHAFSKNKQVCQRKPDLQALCFVFLFDQHSAMVHADQHLLM